jgi:arginyl-tRNA synthetase
MASILSQLDLALRRAIKDAFKLDADPQLNHSQNANFGDYQSNAAMALAKPLGQKPRAVADQIKSSLNLGDIASEISVAGPGFINIRLSPTWLAGQLDTIRTDPRVGIETASAPRTIVVDYSGPNIAKEMHVGNLRSTIIGDAISRVLQFQGHAIVRQNHIGDWGTQFGMLIAYAAHSGIALAQKPNSDKWAAAVEFQPISDLEAFYRDAKKLFDADTAFQESARKQVVALQANQPESLAIWAGIIDQSRNHYEDIYERLGVLLTPEDERGESAYNDLLAGVVADLKAAGIAVESQGAVVVEVPGFESPLIIQKSDGGYLYGTTDLAAIRYRVNQLHAQRIIYTHDSRQSQHFAQVFWTARKAGWVDGVELEYAPFGTMLGEDGKPFKTRSGGTVKLKELLEEAEQRAMQIVTDKNPQLPESTRAQIAHAVGIGAVKYADLSKDRISDYSFSFDKMLALDGNTAPYLQYAHARIRSIFRKTDEKPGPIRLESPFELALAKHVLRLGEIIEVVGRELKPHHLCTYLYDLAARFSGFYENCPVLQSEDPTRASRLALCDLTARTMELGLNLLGIEHPDQM